MKYIPLLFILFICSCATVPRNVMDSWLGAPAEKLVLSWGRPADVVRDGPYEVYIYYRGSNYTSPGYFVPSGNAVAYLPPQNYANTTKCMFWVDAYGIIQRWETRRM